MRCDWQPKAGIDLIGMRCPDCKHSGDIHFNADECPICQMLDLRNQIAIILRREAIRQVDEVVPAMKLDKNSNIHEALMRAVIADVFMNLAIALRELR